MLFVAIKKRNFLRRYLGHHGGDGQSIVAVTLKTFCTPRRDSIRNFSPQSPTKQSVIENIFFIPTFSYVVPNLRTVGEDFEV